MLDLQAPLSNGEIQAKPFLDATRIDLPGPFSPGGEKLVFQSYSLGSLAEFRFARRDGTGLPSDRAGRNALLKLGPWSPDGSRIVFDAAVDGNSDICVVAENGGETRRLTTDPSIEVSPSWSLPYTAEGPSVTVEVERQGMLSEPITVPLTPVRPGIFTLDGSGTGPAAIVNEDGTINSPQNPAARGSAIMIYLTGEGASEPAASDGSILGDALPKPKAEVTVQFEDPGSAGDNYPAEALYAGGATGSVAGLLQVNVRVPQWARLGDAVPFFVQIGGEDAEFGATLAIMRDPNQ